MDNKKLVFDGRLEQVLNKIYKLDVALEVNHASKRDLLLSFLEDFRFFCRQKSPIFMKYFKEFYLTGSYFEGLRVKEATEFDINVAFEFPFTEFSYKINELDELPSFASFQLEPDIDFKSIPFFDRKGYAVKKNMLKWFQSLLDSFCNSECFSYPGVILMRTSNSGPARTVKVLYESVWISIDLVPVFSLNMKHLKKITKHENHLTESQLEAGLCYVVPKPLKPELLSQIPSHLSEYVWRMHFPEAEVHFLKGKESLKRVIMLAKALRDKEDWPIPSYFLKVVALWLVKRNPDDKFWTSQSLSSLFLLFLETLQQHLACGCLGHVFYPRFNLFHSLHGTLLRNLESRVKKIIQLLKKDPDSAFILFKVVSTTYSFKAPSLLLH